MEIHTPGRKRNSNAHKSSGKKQKGKNLNTKGKEETNPPEHNRVQGQGLTQQKNTFEIISTQPQEEKGEILTQTLTKPKQDKKYLQVPAAKKGTRKTRGKEKI